MSACPTPPAPLCATFFGEFGAEVIKVEQPRVGDDLRRLGRSADGAGGGSYGRAELERLRARGVI